MLHSFIAAHQSEINHRVAQRLRMRDARNPADTPPPEVTAFVDQLAASLRDRREPRSTHPVDIGVTATRYGANLVRAGKPITEAVQAYGDICQAVTQLAQEEDKTISAADFCVFNSCLDDAMGRAVSEHARITEETRSADEVQRLGHAAHELRDHLQTAKLSFETLRRTMNIGEDVSGALLGRSLMNLSTVVDRTLADVRLAAGVERREPLPLAAFLQEVADTGKLHGNTRGVELRLESDATGTIDADPQLLMSAVMNLVQNALKFTPPGGRVLVAATTTPSRFVLSVEDQCGGIPESAGELFRSFDDRRGTDRTGMGLGLAIARKVVRFHGGDIRVQNRPGTGCVFTIDMPLVAVRAASAARSWIA
jgi:signal transduction histidine kinase